MTIQDVIVREITVPVPRERAWTAITDPEQITKWFGSTCAGTIAVGEFVTFGWSGEDLSRVRIDAIEPYDRFAYSWHPGSDQQLELPLDQLPLTLVEFLLTSVPGGTRITLRESGFASLPESMRGRATEENSGGWDQEIGELEAYLVEMAGG